MKWLNIILSIYLVALACLPCADGGIDTDHSSTAQKELVADRHNHSEDKHIDNCSPFCICNCCGAQILNYSPVTVFEFSRAISLITVALPTYTSILTSNFHGSIWQPPQLG